MIGLRTTVNAPSVVLFACMFAAQAAILILSPILPAVASDFGVSTATAAQLRAISGVVAGTCALWIGIRSRPRPLRSLLLMGVSVLVASGVASAAAPTFAVLAAAQVAVGVGLAMVLSGALTAAAEWSPETRSKTLSWALVGQPAAWIVGMPLAGVMGDLNWRYAWIAVPLAASLVALAFVAARPRDATAPAGSDELPLWFYPGTMGWALGELLAYSGWAGTLVFVGALFVETYGMSATAVGLLLAGGAVAYLPGNFLARRWVDHRARTMLVGAPVLSALLVVLFGGVRPHAAWSAALFGVLAFLAGARTIAGSSHGLALAPQCPLQAMSFRTAAVQCGYLLGASLGGAALGLRGYVGLGVMLAGLYLLAAVPHVVGVAGSVRPRRVASGGSLAS